MHASDASLGGSDAELPALGAKARDDDIRLSFHPSQWAPTSRHGSGAVRATLVDGEEAGHLTPL